MRAELDVTVDLARALLVEQHPDLAHLPLAVAANGWDNVMVRAGSDLVLRLPRRAVAAPLLINERAALPLLEPVLSAAVPGVLVPVPVREGAPSEALGYPWPWNVLRWVDGVRAASTPVESRRAWAPTLGRFLAALHRPIADGVPVPRNPFRGVPLAARAVPPFAHLAAHAQHLLPGADAAAHEAALRSTWAQALRAPAYDGPPVWIHGDPHPANLVVAPGAPAPAAAGHGAHDRLVAVVDFGDVTAGDPASDLGSLWLTFDAEGRTACRRAMSDAGAVRDEATWVRARGWAMAFAGTMLAHPDEHPTMVPIGEHALAALLDDR
ncbi:aminoglycoside phosphotransferase [Xylanimonas cellulosilytica DSM 15894]|uniref:Aminoglycoside phosphotransferase n=1 Tax=Xylanimonas cellulosilytica (strain DSM 15894 / JCM 12276 / CECT 5975 / KCTC 9989 / LMG 20990 / NBRC 107835 / XIL07) TaxID=446471 RepID=D1BT79_XYLCX|nr:aminoglycoside phosphotransferase family protein [Xylanimonas cellulosilytica]ACZ30921.1 aminoglycoside phosphotransferase [Xylanimonas cellulosilytica DSM 15894]